MVYSSNMNFVLVFPLILAMLSSGHISMTVMKETHNSCYEICPAGYYKTGTCNNPSNRTAYKCEICGDGTYTEIKNYIESCHKCDTCSHFEVAIKNCTFNSNVVCDCREGFYDVDSPKTKEDRRCKSCNSANHNKQAPTNNLDYIKKCTCQSSDCLNNTECQRKCQTTTVVPPTVTSTTTITTRNPTGIVPSSIPSNSSNPDMHHIPTIGVYIYWFVWMAVMFGVVSGLLLLINLFGDPERCPYWRTNKDVQQHTEDPRFNEQRSHQDNASTTLILNPSEETPMMTLSQSPSTPEHPAPVSILLPSTELKVARQDEQSKDWPAIVLYAIIKEVPLRRWKEFLRLLSVPDEQLERVELEAGLGLGSMERQYQMLKLWSQRSSASLDDVFSALHYMELARCAQLLQENLENLQWRAESKQDCTV